MSNALISNSAASHSGSSFLSESDWGIAALAANCNPDDRFDPA
jgi:hypothetical protein